VTSGSETTTPSGFRDQTERLIPGIAAAISFGISDVLVKVVFASGCDELTVLWIRGAVGIAIVAAWLCIGPKPHGDTRVRWFSVGIGVLFACLISCLYKAIDLIDVPTAILTYFAYPLLTGMLAALLGLERLRWQGAACAIVAFGGLAVMIGAHPAGFVFAGVAWALVAACCRTGVLLVTRGFLAGADVRLSAWYQLLSSTLLFVVAAAGTQTWAPPQTYWGWAALICVAVATTASIVLIFVSTLRIGPFRTAVIMNLEPLTVLILSAILLDEVITPVQGVGSAIMLAALVAFQLWR
jgi:probable blue pigment (indigoidine) exporter